METLKILGERLCLKKKKKTLHQSDVAEFLGITQGHYQRMEKGKINIPTLTLCTLADYFGVTADYLLGRSQERE